MHHNVLTWVSKNYGRVVHVLYEETWVATRRTSRLGVARARRVGLALLLGAALFAPASPAFADDGAMPEAPIAQMPAVPGAADVLAVATDVLAQRWPDGGSASEPVAGTGSDGPVVAGAAPEDGSGSELTGDITAAPEAPSAPQPVNGSELEATTGSAAPVTASTPVVAAGGGLISPSPLVSNESVLPKPPDDASPAASSEPTTQYHSNPPQYQPRNSVAISHRMRPLPPPESHPRFVGRDSLFVAEKSPAIGLWNCSNNASDDALQPGCPTPQLQGPPADADTDQSSSDAAPSADEPSGSDDGGQAETVDSPEPAAGATASQPTVSQPMVSPSTVSQPTSPAPSCDTSGTGTGPRGGTSETGGAGATMPVPPGAVSQPVGTPGATTGTGQSSSGTSASPSPTQPTETAPTVQRPAGVAAAKGNSSSRSAEPRPEPPPQSPVRVIVAEPTGRTPQVDSRSQSVRSTIVRGQRAKRPPERRARPIAEASKPQPEPVGSQAARRTPPSGERLWPQRLLVLLLFAVGLAGLALATSLGRPRAAFTALNSRLRSKGLSGRSTKTRARRNPNDRGGGIRYRE